MRLRRSLAAFGGGDLNVRLHVRALVPETKMRASSSWWRSQTECVTLAARRQRQGAADAQAPTPPPQSRSSFQIGGNTNVHGRTGKKREVRPFVDAGGVGADALRLPAGIHPIFLQDYSLFIDTKKIIYFHMKTRSFIFLYCEGQF